MKRRCFCECFSNAKTATSFDMKFNATAFKSHRIEHTDLMIIKKFHFWKFPYRIPFCFKIARIAFCNNNVKIGLLISAELRQLSEHEDLFHVPNCMFIVCSNF
ncbi:hypothetical protein D917_02296 [Trichinella nativa]|uniref:Uncharacterized protein n=1 Tax=Trichinella nativa TaxID=6335 RepID=A0A1Y3EM16_9BILA|nr:hypothetical protein D917_02296 [Trichinella nativa]